jgi:pyridoxal phosphate enzyme (YggS family)
VSQDVEAALAGVRARIAAAARDAGRDPSTIELLLAVKTVSPPRIRAAIAAGGTVLGHNRAQELAATEPELVDLPHQVHFIGHLQSNKINQVLRWVTCVQTVDSESLARRLDRARARALDDGAGAGRLDVLVQVNTSGEDTKSGVEPSAAAGLVGYLASLPALRLRGFMTIGANSSDLGRVRASYDALREVRDAVVGSGEPGTAAADQLSMGMSGDLEIAVAAGATMVRVGSAVFGARG